MLVSAVIESECEKIAGKKDAKNPLRTANCGEASSARCITIGGRY